MRGYNNGLPFPTVAIAIIIIFAVTFMMVKHIESTHERRAKAGEMVHQADAEYGK